jgi:hypothetical protein
MLRRCDGEDPNLVRVIPRNEMTPQQKLAPWPTDKPGEITIRCDCGLEFDDVERFVIWPHLPLPPAEAVHAALTELFHQLSTWMGNPN